MNYLLSINTIDRDRIEICLLKDGLLMYCIEKSHQPQSQQVLPAIEELLARHDIDIRDLVGIKVDTGPGSFTGVRLGVTIANTLATLLNIPINDLPTQTLVYPHYAQSKYDYTP